MAAPRKALGESLKLRLPADARKVSEVRQRLAALAREMGFDDVAIDDLRTVVTEACTNAARHAYAGRTGGWFEVVANRCGGDLEVVVRDFGRGIRPSPVLGAPSPRLGLLLIAALARTVEISSAAGAGTEIRIRMSPSPVAASPSG